MKGFYKHPFRGLWRGATFLFSLILIALDFRRKVSSQGKSASVKDRALWLHRSCRRYVGLLHIDLEIIGKPPEGGLMVSNHMGYVDIIVLCAVTPCVFISKSDVKRWPIFGYFAGLGGTLFVNREKRSDVGRLADEMREILNSGAHLALFPEGTSSGGDSVLPFKSALLEPITQIDLPVTPACVVYSLPPGHGLVSEEVAYWADMTLAPHLLNIFSKERIGAKVIFGEPRVHKADRKQLAKELHAEVLALQQSVRGAGKEKEPACVS
jgi:1-acyl-sn-glycerol-3-phosphate acyltransferase